MIVLDENLDEQRVSVPLAAKHKGIVVSLRTLRPGTIIKVDAIPVLLLKKRNPIFVTSNVADFWRKIPAHRRYCIVGVPLPTERQDEIPELILRLLRHPAFRTAAQRMGKVIRATLSEILFYQLGQSIVSKLRWA